MCSMVDKGKTIPRRYHSYLAENINLLCFAKTLLDCEIIVYKDYQTLSLTNTREDCAKLLLKLYKKCNAESILQCLKASGHEELCKTVEDDSPPDHKSKMFKTPPACGLHLEGQKLIDNFSDKVKMKIHNAEARDCISKFDVWSRTLLNAIKRGNLDPREEQKYADCCFVLLDALIVLYRTHNADRQFVSGKTEFKSMEYLISKTANPTLTRIRYQSRYGVSLFQGGKTQKGLQYIAIALSDATMFMSGKDIGNILFALVNIKLELYARSYNDDLKKEIFDLIESGIRYFENESEDSRNNWRCVYLDKKTCCHLGLNSDGKVIEGVVVKEQDLEKAHLCLLEAEQLNSVMDIRRRMHFYRAKAKYHKHQDETNISDGFLGEALKLAKKGSFHHDQKILMQQCTSFEISSGKQAVEHTTDYDVTPEANMEANCDIDTNDLDKRALNNIARALNIDTYGCINVAKKEPTEN